MWHGDHRFLISNLILKDFRVRYRNMSLGMMWSLLNPLVMLGVYIFVFTYIFQSSIPHYPVFLLCGTLPFNFFTLCWGAGTNSLLENANLIKRVAVPREIVPLASVLSNCLHLGIQITLLIVFVIGSGLSLNPYWLLLPLIWGLELVFIYGAVLFTSSLNVLIRDTRYVVDSANLVLFWLVPVIYPFSSVPVRFWSLYQYNPVAALVMAMRDIVLEGHAPAATLLTKLALVSLISLVVGLFTFRRLQRRFYDFL